MVTAPDPSVAELVNIVTERRLPAIDLTKLDGDGERDYADWRTEVLSLATRRA
jgi:hypothetical protein